MIISFGVKVEVFRVLSACELEFFSSKGFATLSAQRYEEYVRTNMVQVLAQGLVQVMTWTNALVASAAEFCAPDIINAHTLEGFLVLL